MKIGLITEGMGDGADQAVCGHLVKLLLSAAQVVCKPLGNLPALKSDCGKTAQILLQEGCDRIIIVWDLYPGWRTDDEPPCRREHRKEIFAALDEAKVDRTRVELVCIEEELEAWLLADHQNLIAFLSKKARERVRIGEEKHPERIDKPKTRLDSYLRQYLGRQYTDRIHAPQIIKQFKHTDDLKDLRRSITFRRFEEKLKK